MPASLGLASSMHLSLTYTAFFVLFTISMAFSIYAATTPDFLRVSKVPLFNTLSISFGLFQNCITSGSTTTCSEFPTKDCHISLPQHIDDDMSLCQSFLSARWLEIGALAFGSLAWLTWLAMINQTTRAAAVGACLWCTAVHATCQIIINVLMFKRREDPMFYIGGDFGVSHSFTTASWVLDLFLVAMLCVALLMRRNPVYVYVAIP
ncbi:hypothetical protein BASA60_005271 [Batrachochytrium salamandrivorans]|nr:hypothetical protein BASA60_005271 [Batrachochytrium salamandrivorans]KAH9264324.1 hypothetical protein BASA83_012216 [Batrachochytrium salamandrivorans]